MAKTTTSRKEAMFGRLPNGSMTWPKTTELAAMRRSARIELCLHKLLEALDREHITLGRSMNVNTAIQMARFVLDDPKTKSEPLPEDVPAPSQSAGAATTSEPEDGGR